MENEVEVPRTNPEVSSGTDTMGTWTPCGDKALRGIALAG